MVPSRRVRPADPYLVSSVSGQYSTSLTGSLLPSDTRLDSEDLSHYINTLMRAYLVYVRPLLEYNSVVWSPDTIKDIAAIESVQRRFTKRLVSQVFAATVISIDYILSQITEFRTETFVCRFGVEVQDTVWNC